MFPILYVKCVKMGADCPYFTDGKLYEVKALAGSYATVFNDWRRHSVVCLDGPTAHLNYQGWFERVETNGDKEVIPKDTLYIEATPTRVIPHAYDNYDTKVTK